MASGKTDDEGASSTALLVERNSLLEKISDQEKKIKSLEEAAEKFEGEKKELKYRLDSANTDVTQLRSQIDVSYSTKQKFNLQNFFFFFAAVQETLSPRFTKVVFKKQKFILQNRISLIVLDS